MYSNGIYQQVKFGPLLILFGPLLILVIGMKILIPGNNLIYLPHSSKNKANAEVQTETIKRVKHKLATKKLVAFFYLIQLYKCASECIYTNV